MPAADVRKTAIITAFGLFELLHMTFCLRSGAQAFQRFVDMVLQGADFVFCYQNDILVASSDEETHLSHQRQVFQMDKNPER